MFLVWDVSTVRYYGTVFSFKFGTVRKYDFFFLNRAISLPSSVNTDLYRLASPALSNPQASAQVNQVCEHNGLAEVNGVNQIDLRSSH